MSIDRPLGDDTSPDNTLASIKAGPGNRTSWLDTLELLIDNNVCTWDLAGNVLYCPESDDILIHALQVLAGKDSKNPLALFKKNMSNYQFKVYERGRLAFTNDFYNRSTRHDVAKMADFVSLVKAKMKQANDSKKKRKEDVEKKGWVESTEKKRKLDLEEVSLGGLALGGSGLGGFGAGGLCTGGFGSGGFDSRPGPSKLDDAKLLLSLKSQENSTEKNTFSSDALADLILNNLSKSGGGDTKHLNQIPQNDSNSDLQEKKSMGIRSQEDLFSMSSQWQMSGVICEDQRNSIAERNRYKQSQSKIQNIPNIQNNQNSDNNSFQQMFASMNNNFNNTNSNQFNPFSNNQFNNNQLSNNQSSNNQSGNNPFSDNQHWQNQQNQQNNTNMMMIMTMMTKMTQMQNQMQVLMQAVLENQVSKQNLQQNPTVNPPQKHSTKPEPITPTFSSSQTPALTPTLEIQQQLFLAIRCGDLAKTSQIVQSTPNWWELEDENGNIAFMKACCYPDSKVFIVSYLIEQTKNNRVQAVILKHKNTNEENCYLLAAKSGNLEILKYLEGLVPSLLKTQDLKKVQGFHGDYDPVIECKDKNGNDALMLASTSTSLETVKHLIERSSYIKFSAFSKNNQHFTPMLLAIDSGRQDIAIHLAKLSTECLHQKTAENDTPLTLAIQTKGGIEMVKMLVENFHVSIFEGGYLDRLPFMIAAEFEEIEILEYLYKIHQNNKTQCPITQYNDELGDNALTITAKFSSLKIFKFLVEKVKFDPFEIGYLGRNAYHWACVEGNWEIVKYLRSNYPGIQKLADNEGQTGFLLACIYSNVENVKQLCKLEEDSLYVFPFENDVRPTIMMSILPFLEKERGFLNRNCLHSAVIGNNLQNLKFLDEKAQEKAANLSDYSDLWSTLDDNGSSVLTLAAEFSNPETFRYVLEKSRCELSARDGNLRNSLECAISGGNFDNLEFIINHAEGKFMVDTLPENVLFDCLNHDSFGGIDSFRKIRRLLVPILKVRITNLKEKLSKLYKTRSAERYKTGVDSILFEKNKQFGEKPKIHELLQVEFRTIENSWIAIYDEFKLAHPSVEVESSYENAVFEKASADQIVMKQQQLVVTDWGDVADKLKDITHKAKLSFESSSDDRPESLVSTSSGGFRRKNPFSKMQATGNGVELPAQYQRIITDQFSLEGDKAKHEISKVIDCDDQKALMEYICLSLKSKLESTIQRIRRKLIYIVSYRRHQLRTRQVGLDASFNKYTTVHPDRPMYSAKSMLKLIRWCRFFEREYKPIMSISQHVPSNISDTTSSTGLGCRQINNDVTSMSGLSLVKNYLSKGKNQFSSFNEFKKPKVTRLSEEQRSIQFTRNRLDKDESMFYQRVQEFSNLVAGFSVLYCIFSLILRLLFCFHFTISLKNSVIPQIPASTR